MPTQTINLTLQEDITRVALQALITAVTVVPKRTYRITDAVGSSKVVLVKGKTTSTITGYAINETDDEWGVYDIGADTFSAQGFGDFIPLAGTETGNPVTGNIEHLADALTKLFSNFGSHEREISFDDEGGIQVRVFESGVQSTLLQVGYGQITLSVADIITGVNTNVTIANGGGSMNVVDPAVGEGIVSVDGGTAQLEVNDLVGGQAIVMANLQGGEVVARIQAYDGSVRTSIYSFPDRVLIETPNVFDNTATNGQVLTLIDQTTGKAEWQDAGGPSGGFTWSVETADRSMVVNEGVIANKGTQLVLTLPLASAVGDIIEVVGINAGLWRIAQNASQRIRFAGASSTSGTGGYLESTQQRDSVRMVCVVANLEWQVINSVGAVFTII